jgi:hypothetical protein
VKFLAPAAKISENQRIRRKKQRRRLSQKAESAPRIDPVFGNNHTEEAGKVRPNIGQRTPRVPVCIARAGAGLHQTGPPMKPFTCTFAATDPM